MPIRRTTWVTRWLRWAPFIAVLAGCAGERAVDPTPMAVESATPASTAASTRAVTTLLPAPTSTSTTEAAPAAHANLPDYGPAPEITNDTWLNTDSPITLASLRGRVVLIEFWTYG